MLAVYSVKGIVYVSLHVHNSQLLLLTTFWCTQDRRQTTAGTDKHRLFDPCIFWGDPAWPEFWHRTQTRGPMQWGFWFEEWGWASEASPSVTLQVYQRISAPSKRQMRLPFSSVVFNPLFLRMPSSGTLRRVALVRTDVSEELIASIIRVTRIGELGKTSAVTSNRRTFTYITTQRASVASSGWRFS
jgi:hypothetical protein